MENEEILFDPSITSENNVAECFRVGRLSKNPAQRHVTEGPNRRHDKIQIHTDGACFNNDKQNAQCGGVWFGHNDSIKQSDTHTRRTPLKPNRRADSNHNRDPSRLPLRPPEDYNKLHLCNQWPNNTPRPMGKHRLDQRKKRKTLQKSGVPTKAT
jgi:hypothetical protein